MSDNEKWSGKVSLTDKGVDWFKGYAEEVRESLDHPRDTPECYSCHEVIKGKVKFIEYIPLFMRYANYCDECHEKSGQGEYVEVIKKYEEYLAGKATQLNYLKEYYKFHPDDFDKFINEVPLEGRNIIRGWFE